MLSLLTTLLRLGSIPRRTDVDDRAVTVAITARFVDELLSGLPVVLMPSLRARRRLTLTEVGLAYQLLDVTAAVAEPINGVLIDLAPRRWLLVWGAVACGVATVLLGVAPSVVLVAAGFALYGLGSGPLAHTGDVVLIESHPGAVDRILTRSTVVDTVGALLAPAAVAVAAWGGLDWMWLLIGAGGGALAYAAIAAGTAFPGPPRDSEGLGALAVLRRNLGHITGGREARLWIGLLLLEGVVDVPVLFQPVWLREEVGMSQAMVGAHVLVELVASLAGLLLLDRLLVRHDGGTVLRGALLLTALLYPSWLLVPGVTTRFVLAVPLTVAKAPIWPILRGRALASVPGGSGSVAAVTALLGLVPLSLGFGWLAARVGLTGALLAGHLVPIGLMLALLRGPGRAAGLR